MQQLTDLLKQLMQGGGTNRLRYKDSIAKTPAEMGLGSADRGVQTPEAMQRQNMKPPSGSIYNDKGGFDKDQNPFDLQKYMQRSEPGTIMNFVNRLLNPSPTRDQPGLTGGQPTSEDLNPTPSKVQRGTDLAPVAVPPIPTPTPRPPQADYSMPTALRQEDIETLRQSLLTDAGQMDPNNPNGLSGRMNSPLAESDMGKQGADAVNIEDSIRGFDGGPKPRKVL